MNFAFLVEWLKQYGSVREVEYAFDRTGMSRGVDITYRLITDESRTVHIPYTMLETRDLDSIIALFEKHLGELPGRTRNRDRI